MATHGGDPRSGGDVDPDGRVLLESDVVVVEGIESTVRHRTQACVREAFPDQPSLLEDVGLVMSELVANATQAANDRILVRVVAGGGAVTLAVCDDGPGVPHLRRPDPDDPTGRGLLLIDAVADRWGVEPIEPQGKVVWARCSTRLRR